MTPIPFDPSPRWSSITGRPRKDGRTKILRQLLSAALVLLFGYTFGVSMLGGCAGASWPSNGQLPDRVVGKLRDCGGKGPAPIEPVSYDLNFLVHVTEDEDEVRVDDVMLTDSTLHLPEVEQCMIDALHGMRARLSALALRRRHLAPDFTVASEGRPLLGQAQLAWLLEAAVLIVLAAATYHVVVQFARDTHPTKHRPHPVTPETDAPRDPDKESKPESPPEGDPKTTGPTPPLPPPLPPPPKEEKETCAEKMPNLLRCDDPKLGYYPFRSENEAFKSIRGKDLRKEKTRAAATGGPCPGERRGGFHTNVRGKDYVGSIVGCNCCDDSSGKAAQKQKATVIYH